MENYFKIKKRYLNRLLRRVNNLEIEFNKIQYGGMPEIENGTIGNRDSATSGSTNIQPNSVSIPNVKTYVDMNDVEIKDKITESTMHTQNIIGKITGLKEEITLLRQHTLEDDEYISKQTDIIAKLKAKIQTLEETLSGLRSKETENATTIQDLIRDKSSLDSQIAELRRKIDSGTAEQETQIELLKHKISLISEELELYKKIDLDYTPTSRTRVERPVLL